MPNDIILDENFDLQIANGDLVVGESTYQHQRILIFAEKGEFKQYPKVGVGSKHYLESERPDNFAREIRQQFIADGMNVKQIKIGDNLELNIDSDYES
ncbi:hypothetical protein [Chryseobacterium sp. R2A-55]|uniref:hypothetical protein n=1 Tax=Chryseobacterium sp. R2A-55 TaxID=2744445 RepID=UPI001F1E1058|nr:hypothetical protein [Chryseobacterium sp. R2A-55]